MTIAINLTTEQINTLNIQPARSRIERLLKDRAFLSWEQQLEFQVEYDRDPGDPRELSEIPEVRLWFIRLDSEYPWLPFLLNWKAGELARYTAMLVPHQFHPKEGIQFNPEALEIFVMQKIFVLSEWLKQRGIAGKSRLKSFSQTLGYDLEDGFFDLL
jgi:hypothetical protein